MTEQVYSHNQLEPSDMLGANMAEVIDAGIREYGDQVAFSCILPSGHKSSVTYNECDELSDAVAAFLREDQGLKPGDVVAVQCVNALAYPVLIFGVIKAGLVLTNINPLYTPDETQHQLQDSGAKLLFVIDLFGDKLAQATKDTKVEKVFNLSLVDLFPVMQRKFLGFMMRRVKKVVPNASVEFAGSFDDVIKKGRALVRSGVDASKYQQAIKADDILLYQYTGGTTGRSKGAELTHSNLVSNISQGHRRNKAAMTSEKQTMMLVLPMYHVFAFAVGAMSSMVNGTHVVLVAVPRPVSNLKVAFDTYDFTIMPGVNTLYLALLQEDWFRKNPPKTLKYCFSGAAPLNSQTADDWRSLTGGEIFEGYGLTESTCVVASTPLDSKPRIGTCGLPVAGTELRIVGSEGEDAPAGKPGELWVRGPQVMKGYLNRPDATDETITNDGWLKTGDIAIIDEDGYLSIVDRIKDMVIVSGFNVYPTDIEEVLTRYQDVSDAAVVGVPCDVTGEKLIAYVIPGHDGVTEELVVDHCREHLTNYKIPKTVVFVTEFPKSPIGKVLRRELREQALRDFGC